MHGLKKNLLRIKTWTKFYLLTLKVLFGIEYRITRYPVEEETLLHTISPDKIEKITSFASLVFWKTGYSVKTS